MPAASIFFRQSAIEWFEVEHIGHFFYEFVVDGCFSVLSSIMNAVVDKTSVGTIAHKTATKNWPVVKSKRGKMRFANIKNQIAPEMPLSRPTED